MLDAVDRADELVGACDEITVRSSARSSPRLHWWLALRLPIQGPAKGDSSSGHSTVASLTATQ
jgi:hypothetical protein